MLKLDTGKEVDRAVQTAHLEFTPVLRIRIRFFWPDLTEIYKSDHRNRLKEGM